MVIKVNKKERHREYDRRWREQNSNYQKEYYQKHREKMQKQHKEYYEKNKEEILAQRKRYRDANREKVREQNRKKGERYRQKMIKLIGDECIICGSKENLRFHEKYFRPHEHKSVVYIIKHYEDFLPVCSRHHWLIHRLKECSEEERKKILMLLLPQTL